MSAKSSCAATLALLAAFGTSACAPCRGAHVELGAALERRACERCTNAPRPLTGLLAAWLEARPKRVSAGGQVHLRAVLRNRTAEPLEVPFVWHDGPMFTVTATDAAGQPAGVPAGPPPKRTTTYRPGPPYRVCITIEPLGEAFVERTWQAVRWRWVQGAPPPAEGVPPAVERAGPLPAGRYRLRLHTMLASTDEPYDKLGAPAVTVEVVR